MKRGLLTLAKAHCLCKGLVICIGLLVLTACASPLPLPTPAAFGVTPLITLDGARLPYAPSPTPVLEPAIAFTPPPPTPIRYMVKAGDTLLGIALAHHVSMAAIQLANGLGDSTLVRTGQVLSIPPPLAENESPYWVVHVVRAGESLSQIARAYGVTVGSILQVNALANPELIRAGQELIIPLQTLALTPPASTATPRLSLTPIAWPTVARVPDTPARAPTPSLAPLPSSTLPPDVSAWAALVVELINQKRVANDLPPLAVAPELMRAAQAHAQDCSQRGWCSHLGSDGAATLTRIQRAGYEATAWGENWVQALGPIEAVKWWYNETPPNDPHRRNILSSRYSEIGVGVASADYGYYFVADFGRR